MKRALIVGVNGQDGRWLRELFETQSSTYLGISKHSLISNESGWSSQHCDITQPESVFHLIREFRPEEVYYLPAVHFSSEEKLPSDLDLFAESYKINVLSLINFLEGIRQYSKETRLFYAASSHIFGTPSEAVQTELTAMVPTSVYGISKMSGLLSCRFYRETHQVFAAAGILYNHESAYRAAKFLSQRIVLGALKIKRGESSELVVGDLSAVVDWGYAPDYVAAMQSILGATKPEDFIVATGIAHTVLDFVRVTFEFLGLDWKNSVREEKSLLQKSHVPLVGNPEKLKRLTGWEPKTNFVEMIRIMLRAKGEAL